MLCSYSISEYIRNIKFSLAGYNIEMYSNPRDYKNAIDNEKYYYN